MTAYLNALGIICSLGRGPDEVAHRLVAGDCSGILFFFKQKTAYEILW